MKNVICTFAGIVGSWIVTMLGGWDLALQTLLVFQSVDYCTGFIVAAVFHSSSKTETGTLKSSVGLKGLCRKGMMLLVVLVSAQLDKMLGIDVARYAVIIGFCVNELISIVENAGLMGVPIPTTLINAIDILKKKGDEKNV